MKTGATITCWTMVTARPVIMAPRFFRMREKTAILACALFRKACTPHSTSEARMQGVGRGSGKLRVDRCGVPNKADHTRRGHGYVLRFGTVSSILHPRSSELAASSPDKPVRIASVSGRAHRI